MLYPQVGNTAVLKIPFIYPANYVDIDQTSFSNDLQALGRVDLVSFGTLDTSSSSVGPAVDITVFAWAEDVDLQGPSYELQSGIETSEGEEFRAKPVSTVASAIASASSALSIIPVIGPYMKATSVIASSISGLASWFGFSNTPPVEPVTYVKIGTNPNLANAHIGTVTEKLALDPKNELSIDPAIMGFPREDELSMRHFCGRESYLFSTTWSSSDAAELNLATIYVTPELFYSEQTQTALLANYNRVQMTPMCFASNMFTYWRGTIKVRFQILCSRFHRGRLRLYYDPNGSTNFNPLLQLNQVIDLATCTNFEFEVPYMAAKSWKKLTHSALTLSNLNTTYEARGYPSLPYAKDAFNGLLRLEVLNELVAPITTADVRILVYVSAPGIEFAMPRPLPGPDDGCYELSPYDLYSLQSGEDPEPMDQVATKLEQPSDDGHRALIYMGERVLSLRELMKRTYYYMALPTEMTLGTNGGDVIITRVQSISPRFPRYPGMAADPNGTNAIHETLALTPVNYVRFNPLTWISMCFTGMRGSLVWRLNDIQNVTELSRCKTLRSFISYTRKPQVGTGQDSRVVNLITASTPKTNSYVNYVLGGHGGSSVQELPEMSAYGVSNTVSELEPTNIASVPMFSPLKFLSANPLNVMRKFGVKFVHDDDNITVGVDTFNIVDHVYGFRSVPLPPDLYVSAGDDFTLAGFVSVPTVYRASAIIAGPKVTQL